MDAGWRCSRRRCSTCATPSSRRRSPLGRGSGPQVPRRLRPRHPADPRRDPDVRGPATRRPEATRRAWRRGRSVPDHGRLLLRHPRARRHAPLPRRRRHHSRRRQHRAFPAPTTDWRARDRRADRADLVRGYRARPSTIWRFRSATGGATAGRRLRQGLPSRRGSQEAAAEVPAAPVRRRARDVHAPGRSRCSPARPDARRRSTEEHRRVHPGVLPRRARRPQTRARGVAGELVAAPRHVALRVSSGTTTRRSTPRSRRSVSRRTPTPRWNAA